MVLEIDSGKNETYIEYLKSSRSFACTRIGFRQNIRPSCDTRFHKAIIRYDMFV